MKRLSTLTRCASDIDYLSPTPPFHHRNDGISDIENPLKVHRERLIQRPLTQLSDLTMGPDPCAVDDNVNSSEAFYNCRDGAPHRTIIRNICFLTKEPTPNLPDMIANRQGALAVSPVNDGNISTCFCHESSRGCTNSPRTAGDKSDAASEINKAMDSHIRDL
jgi:hypothetical protein